ncbi:DNA-binding transcriptional dual regulator Crp [Grimontia hollisae]|nr:DNA-binding transcriptional dual regulator Crp [Grimontia hollisae]
MALINRTVRSCILRRRLYDENEKVLSQGEPVNYLYLVESGRVSMSMTARNGKTFSLGTLDCDQQLFGEMEFFSGYLCQMDIVASEPIEVAELDANKLQLALLAQPRLSLFFASAIAIDYQDTVEILARRMLFPIAYNVAYDIYQRHLNALPVEGYQKDYLEAERFATSDRVYRRAVKELENLGLIVKKKHDIEIVDIKKLEAYLMQ